MRFFAVLLCFLWINKHGTVFAGSDDPDTIATIFLNNSVIISALRQETDVFNRPESMGYMDRSQLDVISPMSMPQALSYIPGVWMQKTNHGGGSAYIRGLTGYQTLLMIDGIRMNNSTYRSGPNQYLNTVDPLMISHMEVLRGGGSVQYGSDAIGGTIQLLSHEPEFSDSGIKVGGMLYGKYWSSDMEKAGRAEVNIASKKWTFLGGFTYKNLGDIKAGADLGKLHPTGYDEYSMDFKVMYRIASKHLFTAVYQNYKQMDVPLYHKITTGEYSRYHFDPQQRELAYLRFESFYSKKLFSKIRYTISYQDSYEVREKQKSGSDQFIKEQDDVATVGANVELFSKISSIWTASSGVEFYHDWINSKSTSTDLESGDLELTRGLYPDGSRYDNFAVYSLHEFDVNRWNFSAGLRYNLVQLQLEDSIFGNTSVTPDAFVGNLGAIYKLNANHHFTTIINSSFRAPNINDVSSFGIADFRFEVPSYDLKPETSLNKEIGYKVKYDHFSGAFSLFHNKLKDLIVNVPSDYNGSDSLDGYKVHKRENVGESILYGGEFEMEAKLTSHLIGFGNIVYAYGQNSSNDEPMRRIPPFNGKLGLRANISNNFLLMGEWIFAAEQDRLSSGDIADDRIAPGGTPGWNVINLYGTYTYEFFTLSASLQNLFNEAYRIHGSGIDGIGRSFWVSLKININQ